MQFRTLQRNNVCSRERFDKENISLYDEIIFPNFESKVNRRKPWLLNPSFVLSRMERNYDVSSSSVTTDFIVSYEVTVSCRIFLIWIY